ncbi:MAG: PAS domain-containing protein [Verrucomicrobia bacterium]|nr:PAS domain-containing protein [Verrucomicrobiota bacterium]
MQENNLLSEILESVPQAILAISLDGCILACNRNTEFIFHLKRAEVLGRGYREALPPALTKVMSALVNSNGVGGTMFDDEFDYQVDRRTTLKIGITLAPMLDCQDCPTGYVFVLRDMSLRHEVQDLRKLHQMNLEFVHTVSHEIKAPLTTILLGTGNLLLQANAVSPQDLETVQMIDESAKRIQDLVADLLDVTKLESGHSELEAEVDDLGAVAKKLVTVYHSLQRAEIQLEIEEGLPPIRFDRKKIHRAMENLIVNAIKYSPVPPRIQVKIKRRGEAIRVSVADQGVGIAADQLPLVWEKFYRGLSPTTAGAAGSGLGLTIVKHIVALHGGQVEAESEPGKGSVFSFTLPLRGRAPAAVSSASH